MGTAKRGAALAYGYRPGQRQRAHGPAYGPENSDGLVLEKTTQSPIAGRMSEFFKRPGLDLAHAFPTEIELFANFLERAHLPVTQAKPRPQNILFARRQGPEAGIQILGQLLLDGCRHRTNEGAIGDEIAQATLPIGDRRLQR